MWPWTTKPVLSRWGIFVAIAKNTLCESKLLIFLFYTKIIRTLSKDHVPWRYLVNFLNILIFLHPQIPDFKCVWRMDDLDGGAQCRLLPGAHCARFGPEDGKESHEFRPEYCSAMWYIQPEARQHTHIQKQLLYCSLRDVPCSGEKKASCEYSPHWGVWETLYCRSQQRSLQFPSLLIWAFLNEKREKR